MAMGKRKHEEQRGMWVAVSELPKSVSHPFYEKLNGLLAEHGFDELSRPSASRSMPRRWGGPVWRLDDISVFYYLATSNAWTRNVPWRGARRTRRECARFSVWG